MRIFSESYVPVGYATPPAELGTRPPLTDEAPIVRGSGYRDVWTGGWAKGLTPKRITAMLDAAEQGYPMELLQVLQEMEDRDLHIVGILGTRRRAVTQLPWEIKPKDDSRRAKKIADYVRAKLGEVDDFEGALVGLMDGVSKGFAIRELDWAIDNGEVCLRRMKYCPAWWFRPDLDNPEQFRLLDATDLVEGKPLVPGRFVVHRPMAKAGVPIQAGLGRALLWWYLFKNMAVKDWVTFVELFGAPLRIGKAPMNAKPNDIKLMETALAKLGVDAWAVIPPDFSIEFISGKDAGGKSGGADAFSALATFCNSEMSKAVLGQTLTTEQGSSGAKALGEVHNQVRLDLLRSDAHQLSRTIQHGVVVPMVTWQYPDAGDYMPHYCIDAEPPEDEKAREEGRERRGKVFQIALDIGLEVPTEQVQAELGIRAPTGSEPTLKRAATPPARPAPSSAWPSGPLQFATAEGAELSDQMVLAAEHFLAQGGLAAWGDLVATLRAELHKASSPEDLADRYLQIIADLDLERVAQSLADATLTGELIGRAQVIDGERPIADVPMVPPREAIAYWTARGTVTATEFYRLADEHRTKAFTASGFSTLGALQETKDLLGQILQEGGTFNDFEDAMDGVFARAGMDPKSPWRLRTIYENAVGTAYSVGRYTEQTRPERLARRPYGRYHDAGDSRVRPAHRAMANKVWPMSSPVWLVWTPPNGHKCRCYVTTHSLEEVRANGWVVMEALPVVDESMHDLPPSLKVGDPLTPDRGWANNPALQPTEYDWTRFDPAWRGALKRAA